MIDTAAYFRSVRELYGETQEQFGRRIGFLGKRETVERAVRRYEKGETELAGPMAVLIILLHELKTKRFVKPDAGRRSKATATKGKRE